MTQETVTMLTFTKEEVFKVLEENLKLDGGYFEFDGDDFIYRIKEVTEMDVNSLKRAKSK